MRLIPLTLGLTILGAMPAVTQAASPSAAMPAANAAAQAESGDALFARRAAAGGMAEVELGKLAAGKATNPDVKAFAQTMVNDHTAANKTLMSLAKSNDIQLPTGLDETHAALRDDLQTREGADFDQAYIRAQVDDHQKMLQLLTDEVKAGGNADLQAFARTTLPKIEHHLDMAKALAAQVATQKSDDMTPRPTTAAK